jgi:hypothetical protein
VKMLAPYHVLGDAGVADALVVGLCAEPPHGSGFLASAAAAAAAVDCGGWFWLIGDRGSGLLVLVGGGSVLTKR